MFKRYEPANRAPSAKSFFYIAIYLDSSCFCCVFHGLPQVFLFFFEKTTCKVYY
jgi:hypothetical protein